MSQIIFYIKPALVDNLIPLVNHEIVYNIKNNSNRIEIISSQTSPISEFHIKESAAIEIKNNLNPHEEQSLHRILAISCSLACENVIFSIKNETEFSSLQIDNSKAESDNINRDLADEGDQNGNGSMTILCKPRPIKASIKGVMVSVKQEVIFDEVKFLRIFKILSRIGIFESKNTFHEQNFVESLHEYELAINSENRYECFKHLFCSLEKIVNMKKEYFQKDFDREVSKLTGINENDVNKFKRCYNRMKHCSRDADQVLELKCCLQEMPLMIRKLKKGVDNSIFLRINLGKVYNLFDDA